MILCETDGMSCRVSLYVGERDQCLEDVHTSQAGNSGGVAVNLQVVSI
jgi:hypothetical protein